jgi:hypothetical protein
MRQSEYRGLTMELLMSPIGLIISVMNLSPAASRVEGEVVFEYTEASNSLVDFFGTSHLGYRIRPMPRPP